MIMMRGYLRGFICDQVVVISAKSGYGMPALKEALLLQAEVPPDILVQLISLISHLIVIVVVDSCWNPRLYITLLVKLWLWSQQR